MSERIGFAQVMLATSFAAAAYWLATAVYRAATELGGGFAPFWQQALIAIVLLLPLALANAVSWLGFRLVAGHAQGPVFNILVGVGAGFCLVLLFRGWMGAWNSPADTRTMLPTILAAILNLGAILAIASFGVQPRMPNA